MVSGTYNQESLSHTSSFPKDGDLCQNHDEVFTLRNQLCKLRLRIEELEEERNYNAAKANEMRDMVQEQLVRKSLEVTKMSTAVNKLQGEIKSLKDEKIKLQTEREMDRSKMNDLSDVVRSLQYAVYVTDDDDSDEDSESDHNEEHEECILTAQKALDMTLKNMKMYIESLEDERQQLSITCQEQEKEIVMLKRESDLKDVKVSILEELFRSLNQERMEIVVPEKNKNESHKHNPTHKHHDESHDLAARTNKSDSHPRGLLLKVDEGERSDETRRVWSNFGLVVGLSSRTIRPRNKQTKNDATMSRSRKNIILSFGEKLEGTYSGPVVDGKPNGIGSIRFSNGDTYLGEVKDGMMHGKGTLYHSSKELGITRGQFKSNQHMGDDVRRTPRKK